MGSILIICAIPALIAFVFSLVLFFGRSKRSKAQRALGGAVFALALGMCYPVVFQIPFFQHAYLLDWVLTTASVLAVPLFYYYIRNLTDRGSPMFTSAFFLPAVIISTLNLILYYMMGHEGAQTYFYQVTTTGSLGDDPSALWIAKRVVGSYSYRAVILVTTVIAMRLSFTRVKDYHRDVEEYHANADEKYFHADRMVFYSSIALMVSVLLYSALPFGQYIGHPFYLIVLSIAIGSAVVLVAYYGLKQTHSAVDLKKLGVLPLSSLSTPARTELIDKLDNLKDNEICYDPQLTIASLSRALSVEPEVLGSLINKRYGTSFSNFINDIRIKKAQEIMRQIPAGTPLTKVSRKCGYQTYASFSKNFEAFAHLSPSEWMRRYR